MLSDSKAMDGFHAEHGLSFLIEIDQMKVLFDTGASNLFLKNAKLLDIDLRSIDSIVLSHGHYDHGNGLQYLEGKPLVCHPECFVRRFHKNGHTNLGISLSRQEVEEKFILAVSRTSLQLSEHLFFLGEIPRINDFESRTTNYHLEGGEEDYIIDDSGLACLTKRGLVVISGCAHSGICNMVEHARKVTGIDKVQAVIGGFHLKKVDKQITAP